MLYVKTCIESIWFCIFGHIFSITLISAPYVRKDKYLESIQEYLNCYQFAFPEIGKYLHRYKHEWTTHCICLITVVLVKDAV